MYEDLRIRYNITQPFWAVWDLKPELLIEDQQNYLHDQEPCVITMERTDALVCLVSETNWLSIESVHARPANFKLKYGLCMQGDTRVVYIDYTSLIKWAYTISNSKSAFVRQHRTWNASHKNEPTYLDIERARSCTASRIGSCYINVGIKEKSCSISRTVIHEHVKGKFREVTVLSTARNRRLFRGRVTTSRHR